MDDYEGHPICGGDERATTHVGGQVIGGHISQPADVLQVRQQEGEGGRRIVSLNGLDGPVHVLLPADS